MEKEKSELEQLLNSLIKRWRVPFGESRIEEINRAEQYAWNWNWCCWGGAMQRRKSTRQIVSKESWLWQYACENELVPKENHERVYDVSWWEDWVNCKVQIISREPEYRFIETSLKNEDGLEQFLLNSIKLD